MSTDGALHLLSDGIIGLSGLGCLPLMLEDEVIGRKAFRWITKQLHRPLFFPLLPQCRIRNDIHGGDDVGRVEYCSLV